MDDIKKSCLYEWIMIWMHTKNGINKTAIVYKTNLNFRLADKYLLLLEKQGLLEKKSDKYFISDKGKNFLGKAKDLTIQLETIILCP
jgi:predicted transcriptional regulator